MKALLWQGHRIETDDHVADTAFELARLLVRFNRTERIDLPVEVEGRPTTASLVVGAGMGLGILSLPDRPDRRLPGGETAVAEMESRIAHLDDSPHGTGFRLPDDFSVLDHDITS